MRIFWLGMHKILIKTELPRLRELGFEVFCPRLIERSGEHQSAAEGWTSDQPTTLTPEIFNELSMADFFGSPISDRIARLLRQYFDVVIVTIDPEWLSEILRVFDGTIIYRTYGHIVNMSEYLHEKGALKAVYTRTNFWYLPHSEESARYEHFWLKRNMKVAPYCVLGDVLEYQDTWQGSVPEIMVSCPNIANPYYRQHFEYLKKEFSGGEYRYYGVQTSQENHDNLVGTLPYKEVLARYQQASAFLYTYKSPTVCFLPPIEMMIVGGPVVYFRDSLLDQYFGSESPGRVETEEEARQVCQKLIRGDAELRNKLIKAQEPVRNRYLPEKVWPIFDKIHLDLLRGIEFGNYSVNSRPIILGDYREVFEYIKEPCHIFALDFIRTPKIGQQPSKRVATVLQKIRGFSQSGSLVLLMSYSAIPYFIENLHANSERKFILLALDRKLPDKPPRRVVVPDRTKRRAWRAFKNPGWALRVLWKRLKPNCTRRSDLVVKRMNRLKMLKGREVIVFSAKSASRLMRMGFRSIRRL